MIEEFNAQGYSDAIANEFTIVNMDKVEVPFVLNDAQHHFVFKVMTKFREIVILKARKMGFSSVVLAIIVLKFLLGKNERCVSMSFDSEAASKQLERAKKYIRSYERLHGIKIPFKYNSKKEMVYERQIIHRDPETGEITHIEEIVNTLRIGTAKSSSFGRGDDVTLLHVTETSLCDDMDALLAGIGEACVPGAYKIFETTANGFNSFKSFWDNALDKLNGFFGIFYSAEWMYSMDFINEKRRRLGRVGRQEYPLTAEEAFLTSGECYFDAENIGDMLQDLKEQKEVNFQF